LKEVTKIEVYEGTWHKDKGNYVACMVFYKGETIVGAPYAGKLTGKVSEANFKACLGINFQLLASYETPR
jgi:hypothetical protein